MNSPTSPIPAPGAPLPHYISTAPFDPQSIEAATDEQSQVYLASQLKLMWWKFKRHKLALASGIEIGMAIFTIDSQVDRYGRTN